MSWRFPVPGAPGLVVLKGYRRTWLRGDLVAGITVAAYLVPQVMAYASVAGLPPVVGLWAILPAIVLYAFLGSSRLLSVGPESTTALMTATVVGPLAGVIPRGTPSWPRRSPSPSASCAWWRGLRGSASWPICCRSPF